MKTWRHAIHDAAITGSVAAVATAACAAICGKLESGSALAPLNAVSHVLWGSRAANVETATLTETIPGLAINEGASLFWATCYEKRFWRTGGQGQCGPVHAQKLIRRGIPIKAGEPLPRVGIDFCASRGTEKDFRFYGTTATRVGLGNTA